MPPSNHKRRASPQPVQSWPIQDDNSCGPGCKRDIPPPPTRHQSSNFGHFSSTGKLMDFHCDTFQYLDGGINIDWTGHLPQKWVEAIIVHHQGLFYLRFDTRLLEGWCFSYSSQLLFHASQHAQKPQRNQGCPCRRIIASSGTRTPYRATNVVDLELHVSADAINS